MYCVKCGKQYDQTNIYDIPMFCPYCGTKKGGWEGKQIQTKYGTVTISENGNMYIPAWVAPFTIIEELELMNCDQELINNLRIRYNYNG